MKKDFDGRFYSGQFFIDDRAAFDEQCKLFKDGPGVMTLNNPGAKSRKQQGYYWSCIVPYALILFRDKHGYREYKNNDDIHELLKYRYNPVYRPDPETGEVVRYPGSTAKMTMDDKRHYIDAIVNEAWDKWQFSYPPPKKGQDKYAF